MRCRSPTLVRNLLPWFVSRQVFTGAGKVGSENGAGAVDYQISQRADFFEEEVGLETTLKRPIVNTRDEPHADPQLYRRLHVIAGDANLCEVATFLKVGTTAIVLAMIEDGFIEKDLSIIGPVNAMRTVSHDPTCRATVELLDGGRITAVELQWEFLRLAQKYADETGLDACGGDDVGGMVLSRWESVLTDLERDPMLLDGQLDWVTKLSLLQAYIDRDELEWSDPKLSLLDLQYHDVRPDRSLYEKLVRAGKVERLVDGGRGADRDHGCARHHPGVVPGRLPRPLARRRGGSQLGQPDPRRRLGSVAAHPDDGAAQGNEGARATVVRSRSAPPPSSSSGCRDKRSESCRSESASRSRRPRSASRRPPRSPRPPSRARN